MKTYSKSGIPTIYNGVQFRSRLEASWAAFFDLCHWEWEYEPTDMAGWIPDFALYPYTINPTPTDCIWVADKSRAYFVEVKPITTEDTETENKISAAGYAYGTTGSPHNLGLILVGNGPLTNAHPWVYCLGWMMSEFWFKKVWYKNSRAHHWSACVLTTFPAFLGTLAGKEHPVQQIDFIANCSRHGIFDTDELTTFNMVDPKGPVVIDELWKEARNRVQWKGAQNDG